MPVAPAADFLRSGAMSAQVNQLVGQPIALDGGEHCEHGCGSLGYHYHHHASYRHSWSYRRGFGEHGSRYQ
jgi:hypothetical protein